MEENQTITLPEPDPTPVLLHEKVDGRIKIRLWIYFFVALAVSGTIIYHLISGQGYVIPTCLTFLVGAGLGNIVSRIYKISWDHGAKKVISRLDDLGIVILILYIVFEISRETIVGFFVQGPAVVGLGLALFDGLMVGRVLGIRGKIKEIFEQQNIQ